MRTDSPAPVIAQIGMIEDALAIAQNAHAEQKALEFELNIQVKKLRAELRPDAEGNNKDERDAALDLLVANTTTYEEWAAAKTQTLKHDIRYEYLSKRLSACQSVLKNFQHDASAGRYGSGRPQEVPTPDG